MPARFDQARHSIGVSINRDKQGSPWLRWLIRLGARLPNDQCPVGIDSQGDAVALTGSDNGMSGRPTLESRPLK